MGFFSKKNKLTDQEISELLDYIDKAYIECVKALVKIASNYKKVKDKNVYKFEAGIFVLFRFDYYLAQLNLINHPIREWLNKTIDCHINSIGSFNPEWLILRMAVYTNSVGNIADENDFYKKFIISIYDKYFGLLKRAAEIDDWWEAAKIDDDAIIPFSGLELYSVSIPIEENVVLPVLKILKESVEKLGIIKK